MIPFNKPSIIGNELEYIQKSVQSGKISGDGFFSKKCHTWFEKALHVKKALLTPSCTHSLEMAALLLDIKQGDEVIMPSFTFVSSANAFVLRGAKIVFVDIREDTLNIDERCIEQAITKKTKAIVVVHYAGVSCEMDEILGIAKKYNLFVVEDAAQGISSFYKQKPLGSIGDLGTFSFHETKNITSGGEGGLLSIKNDIFCQKAEIIREKGTNRSAFFKGLVDKYSWVDIGSSYLLNDISAAFLYAQLENVDKIIEKRVKAWNFYQKELQVLEDKGYVKLPYIPLHVKHNAHIFYIITPSLHVRDLLLKYLCKKQISAVFHYIPLHNSHAGKEFGEFRGEDKNSTKQAQRLLRLPIFYDITKKEQQKVINAVKDFFET